MEENKRPSLSLLLPVFNEASRLRRSVVTLHSYLSLRMAGNFEIIISNDGSTDDTHQIAAALSEELPNVRLIGYAKNMGRGYAIKNARNYALGDNIIFIDCDLPPHIDLAHIDTMLSLLKEYDIVIASRFHRQATIRRKWHRAFISFVYRAIVRCIFRRFKVTDPDVGFKGFRRDVFNEVTRHTNLNGWEWDLQFLVYAHQLGFSITEFPFNWDETIEYKSTVSICKDSIEEFCGLIYIKYQTLVKPLRRL